MVACLRLFLLAVGVLLTASSTALAQQRGSVGGRVLDPAGLPLPGATVTVTEINTGFTRSVVTADAGAYAIPNLEPGRYTVTVEMPTFVTIKRTDLVLTAGLAVTLDYKMQMAGLEEAITVTAESPLVQTSSNQIGGSLSSREIE